MYLTWSLDVFFFPPFWWEEGGLILLRGLGHVAREEKYHGFKDRDDPTKIMVHWRELNEVFRRFIFMEWCCGILLV